MITYYGFGRFQSLESIMNPNRFPWSSCCCTSNLLRAPSVQQGLRISFKKTIRQFPLYNSATLPFLREMICLSQLEMDGLGFGVLHYSKKSESPCRLPQNSFSTASCASCSGHLPKGQGPTRYLVTKEDKTAVHENNINQLYRIVYRILGLWLWYLFSAVCLLSWHISCTPLSL